MESVSSIFAGSQDSCWVNDNQIITIDWSGSLSLYSITESFVKKQNVYVSDIVGGSIAVAMLENKHEKQILVSGFEINKFEQFKIINNKIEKQSNEDFKFDSKVGDADCILQVDHFIISGHSNGFILIWDLLQMGDNKKFPVVMGPFVTRGNRK